MAVSAESRFVLFEQTESIARITLDRPEKLNAINHETGVQLFEAFARCEDDPSIRAIVLAGAGRASCAGDELGRERPADEEEARRRRGRIKHYVSGPGRWTSTVKLMRSLSQPIVVRIQGYAYGAGFNLALAGEFPVSGAAPPMAPPFLRPGLAHRRHLLHQFV